MQTTEGRPIPDLTVSEPMTAQGRPSLSRSYEIRPVGVPRTSVSDGRPGDVHHSVGSHITPVFNDSFSASLLKMPRVAWNLVIILIILFWSAMTSHSEKLRFTHLRESYSQSHLTCQVSPSITVWHSCIQLWCAAGPLGCIPHSSALCPPSSTHQHPSLNCV